MSARRNCPIIRAKREHRAEHADRYKRRRRRRRLTQAEPAIWAWPTGQTNR